MPSRVIGERYISWQNKLDRNQSSSTLSGEEKVTQSIAPLGICQASFYQVNSITAGSTMAEVHIGAYKRIHSAPNPVKLAWNTVDISDTLIAHGIMQ
jgi:hypothetical protein